MLAALLAASAIFTLHFFAASQCEGPAVAISNLENPRADFSLVANKKDAYPQLTNHTHMRPSLSLVGALKCLRCEGV